ncbi:MAG: glycosyltransferase family 4 protein [Fimbriiglobus sp.]
MTPLRILFVADRLHWPRRSGTDVHGTQMMRALAARGHQVTLGTFRPPPAAAVAGLGLAGVIDLFGEPPSAEDALPTPTRLQAKFERYWGTDSARQRAVGAASRAGGFGVVVILGADAMPLFRGVRAGRRVWYAADDAGLHHWSRVRAFDPTTWKQAKLAAIHGLSEWAFAGLVDRVWVVSDADRRAMRAFTGGAAVDVVANGVDADEFRPPDPPPAELPNSCVFWGRLDFGPNEDALRWFVERVWPRVREQVPDFRFDVFGFQPTPQVVELCRVTGVSLVPDLPDLRAEICRRQLVVLPFVSGRGIKNKLLEAAALGRPVVGTPHTLTGARGRPPVLCESTPAGFAREILEIGSMSPETRADLGRQMRAWVSEHHTWAAAAASAEAGLLPPGAVSTGRQ